jgi:hypothetical protein
VGSGNGAERVTRQEVELDPPSSADWIARSRIVYAGAPAIDVYLYDTPVVAANTAPDDAATMLEVKASKLVDTPIGVAARTAARGRPRLLVHGVAGQRLAGRRLCDDREQHEATAHDDLCSPQRQRRSSI